MTCHTTNILVDGHIVVIEYDDQRLTACTGIVERLIRHTAGQRTVTDNGDDMILFTSNRACVRHTQRDRYRTGGMTGDARVCRALVRLHKAAKSPVHTQSIKCFFSSGQNFMNIALMTNIIN